MIYLLVTSFRQEDTNDLILCHASAALTLEGTTDDLFKIFDGALQIQQKAMDEIDRCSSHDINSADYVDYIRKRNGFLLPYVTLRDKVRKKVPLKKTDFDGITIFGVGIDRTTCLYLNLYELDSYDRTFDVVETTIDMLGYWDEYYPKLKETTNSNQLFGLLYEACGRYNKTH